MNLKMNRRTFMNKFEKFKIGDIGKVVGGATPSTSIDEYYGGTIPWLTPKDLSTFYGRYISRGERNITVKGLRSCSAKMLPAGSILFTSRAPIGYVAIAKNPICTNQGFKSIIPLESVNNIFLYYLLKYNKENIEAMGSGTTFKEVSGATMRNIEVNVPPLEVQMKIANILSSLDDKIELNHRINDNLEQQAQAVFKSWFVGFEPFKDGEFVESELGMIPKGWKVGRLSDLVEVKYGKDHKKLLSGSIPVFGSGGIMRYVDSALFTEESVLIPRKGTLNNVIYMDSPFWSVDTMFYSVMKVSHIAKYVYFFMSSKDLASMNAGSAVPSMTTEILNNLLLVIPSCHLLEQFDKTVSPLFAMLRSNKIQNSNLAQLRDSLLPKLMSGELSVDPV